MKTSLFLTLIPVLIPMVAGATGRSATYQIPADTVDGGGERAVNSNAGLSNEAGFGTFAAAASVASGVINHSGYAGQLAGPTNLVVTAAAIAVDELGRLQCTATAQLDDGSWLAITTSAARWSVPTGPASIGPASGLLTAQAVYQDTEAVVKAGYLGLGATLGLLIRDSLPDNFGSYAGDGLSDRWQVSHFGLNNPNALAGVDPDLDGQDNAYECKVGTSPTDPNSRLTLTISPVPGQPARRLVVVSPATPDRTYRLEYRDSLVAGDFIPLPAVATLSGGLVYLSDQWATNVQRFYRVAITTP
jgi:hypothetical protein